MGPVYQPAEMMVARSHFSSLSWQSAEVQPEQQRDRPHIRITGRVAGLEHTGQ